MVTCATCAPISPVGEFPKQSLRKKRDALLNAGVAFALWHCNVHSSQISSKHTGEELIFFINTLCWPSYDQFSFEKRQKGKWWGNHQMLQVGIDHNVSHFKRYALSQHAGCSFIYVEVSKCMHMSAEPSARGMQLALVYLNMVQRLDMLNTSVDTYAISIILYYICYDL